MINATVNFEYWLDEIMPSVVGAEKDLVLQHIRAAAIEFCEQSMTWRVEALPINVIATQRQYNLTSPYDDTEIVQVLEAYVKGKRIEVTSEHGMAYRNASYAEGKGRPNQYVQDYPESIRLYPLPDSTIAGGLSYSVALRPSRIASGMNGSIGKKYFEAISHAAKARLFEIPAKTWSEFTLSAYHRAKFKMLVAHARDEAVSGYGRGAKRVVSHT